MESGAITNGPEFPTTPYQTLHRFLLEKCSTNRKISTTLICIYANTISSK